MFLVTKTFTSGTLVGLTHTGTSPVAFEVGREYRGVLGTGNFIVTACVAVAR